jgi:hypothetical protein
MAENTVDTTKAAQQATNAGPDVPAIVTAAPPKHSSHPGIPNAAPVKLTMFVEPVDAEKGTDVQDVDVSRPLPVAKPAPAPVPAPQTASAEKK